MRTTFGGSPQITGRIGRIDEHVHPPVSEPEKAVLSKRDPGTQIVPGSGFFCPSFPERIRFYQEAAQVRIK